jgi:hypothetical protein
MRLFPLKLLLGHWKYSLPIPPGMMRAPGRSQGKKVGIKTSA